MLCYLRDTIQRCPVFLVHDRTDTVNVIVEY